MQREWTTALPSRRRWSSEVFTIGAGRRQMLVRWCTFSTIVRVCEEAFLTRGPRDASKEAAFDVDLENGGTAVETKGNQRLLRLEGKNSGGQSSFQDKVSKIDCGVVQVDKKPWTVCLRCWVTALLTTAKKKNGEMAQQLGTPLLPESLGSVLNTYPELTTVWNYSSRGSVHLT